MTQLLQVHIANWPGSGLADWLTALGTIAAAAAAVGIALWSDRRARETLAAQQAAAQAAEQLDEAYAIQVDLGSSRMGPGVCAMIQNHGRYAITQVEAQFSIDNRGMVPHSRASRADYGNSVPLELRAGVATRVPDPAFGGSLSRWDTGMQFWLEDTTGTGPVGVVVRWSDRWGQRWEYRRREVHRVTDSDPWTP